MKKPLSNLHKQDFLYAFIILVLGALAYLLLIKRLGFYGDDWYLIFDAHTQGPQFFKTVFYSDRPARAYVLGLAYMLFGDNLVYYHLSAFLFRFLASMALYWTLNIVWKQNRFPNFLMALFFMIYPGFLSQVQPVDYQSQIFSLCLAMISIALTVKAVQIRSSFFVKIFLFVISILTGLFYLALVEYFIGMEFLRLFFVACLVWQQSSGTVKQKIFRPLVRWLPYSIIPIGFLIWRVFLFKNTRVATDVSLQLGKFFELPLLSGLHLLVNIAFGTFNSVLAAWVVPFSKIVMMGGFSLGVTLLIFAIGIGAVIILLLGLWANRFYYTNEQADSNWIQQAFWGGLAAVFVGIIPIIITNRTVDFDNSRYTLASSPGAIMMLVAGISLLRSHSSQFGAAGLLVLLSVTTHFGNALNHVYQADSLRGFWWQVSWRAPSIEVGTNLLVSYASVDTPEDYVIWGPANLIYYPEKQATVPIMIKLPASILAKENILNILGTGNGYPRDRRGNYVREDFTAILVLTQPTSQSCVHILDGSMPELSFEDPYEVMLVAPYSLIGNVNMADTLPFLPTKIFGEEPEHGWCYYYEKAALARQFGDWSKVISLGDESIGKGLKPVDQIEWMPFLQAYVVTGQINKLEPYASIMSNPSLIRQQTCRILKQTASEKRPDDIELMKFIDSNFCPVN